MPPIPLARESIILGSLFSAAAGRSTGSWRCSGAIVTMGPVDHGTGAFSGQSARGPTLTAIWSRTVPGCTGAATVSTPSAWSNTRPCWSRLAAPPRSCRPACWNSQARPGLPPRRWLVGGRRTCIADRYPHVSGSRPVGTTGWQRDVGHHRRRPEPGWDTVGGLPVRSPLGHRNNYPGAGICGIGRGTLMLLVFHRFLRQRVLISACARLQRPRAGVPAPGSGSPGVQAQHSLGSSWFSRRPSSWGSAPPSELLPAIPAREVATALRGLDRLPKDYSCTQGHLSQSSPACSGRWRSPPGGFRILAPQSDRPHTPGTHVRCGLALDVSWWPAWRWPKSRPGGESPLDQPGWPVDHRRRLDRRRPPQFFRRAATEPIARALNTLAGARLRRLRARDQFSGAFVTGLFVMTMGTTPSRACAGDWRAPNHDGWASQEVRWPNTIRCARS